MKLIKHVLVFLVLSLPLAAQQQSVYQKMFTAQSTAAVSAVVRSIGQTFHHLDVFGSASCSTSISGFVTLEGSSDNMSFVSFTPPLTTLSAYSVSGSPFSFYGSVGAAGSYAYVRARYTQPNVLACQLTVYYSGNVSGNVTSSQAFTVANDTFSYFTINTASPNTTPLQQFCTAGTSMEVYSVALSSAVVNDVTVKLVDKSSGPTNVLVYDFSMAANSTVVLPQGSRPYFTSAAPIVSGTPSSHVDLQITSTGSGLLGMNFAFRCE